MNVVTKAVTGKDRALEEGCSLVQGAADIRGAWLWSLILLRIASRGGLSRLCRTSDERRMVLSRYTVPEPIPDMNPQKLYQESGVHIQLLNITPLQFISIFIVQSKRPSTDQH